MTGCNLDNLFYALQKDVVSSVVHMYQPIRDTANKHCVVAIFVLLFRNFEQEVYYYNVLFEHKVH
jgi:hypothetical protein